MTARTQDLTNATRIQVRETLLLHRRVPEVAFVQFRNSEMSAKVQQIHRAQVSGDGDERQASRRFGKYHRSANIHSVEHKPDIRGSVPQRAAVICCCHYVLPTAEMIRSSNRLNCAFIRDAGFVEAHGVDAYAVQFMNSLANRS